MDLVFLVLMTLLCITNIMAYDLRQLCTLNLFYVVIPHCSINVSNISYNTHVEYVGTKGASQIYHLSFDDNKVLKIINWIC